MDKRDLEKQKVSNYILRDNIKYYFKKKHAVVTGVKINNIYDFDNINSSCKIDFNLWFRFSSDIQASCIDNIVFTNSTVPFCLSTYINKNNNSITISI